MSKMYDDLTSLRRGRYDWKIQVRVIRMWRGISKTGEEFKSFNILLLDKKMTRIHAFIPGFCADDHYMKLTIGKVYLISNFTVQQYKPDEKFRCVYNDSQLLFSNDTKIKEIEEKGTNIAQDAFDFYDHSDLTKLSTQNVYLTDVVGIIKLREPLGEILNRHGQKQWQSNFIITDGSSNVKVTFWDSFAVNFEQQMEDVVVYPVIIIIASCRVSIWNEAIVLSNISATSFYLNYNHHSVLQIRKRLAQPLFAKQIFAAPERKKLQLYTIEAMQTLDKEHIEDTVMVHVKITDVDKSKWYIIVCTTCNKECEIVNKHFLCSNCNRIVPHPDKKFAVSIVGTDKTAAIHIKLTDREIRTLVGKRVYEIIEEQGGDDNFPLCLTNLDNMNCTIVLLLKEMNIVDKIEVYTVVNICIGFTMPEEEIMEIESTMEQSTTEATTSTYHIDGMSENNIHSP